ncbi:MAG: bifunctional nuclease family protein [Candidatus Bathyarchaeia archaeon]
MIRVKVDKVGIIPQQGAMSIFLKDQDQNRILVIQVGLFEGSAILYGMNKIKMQRPLTHDLLNNLIHHLGGEVKFLLIHDLVGNTYHAEIFMEKGGEEFGIDTRPSDGIAVCLRADAPIYVSEKLGDKFIDEMDLILAQADDNTSH